MTRKLLENLKRIDFFISKRATGSPAKMAARMELSQTTLFAYMAIMKKLGTPIRYDKHRKTYYYAEEGNFVMMFKKRTTANDK